MKNGDFIRLDYTGTLSDGTVFDTTKEDVAKAAGITSAEFGPVTIRLGDGMLLATLEKALVGKQPGTHTIPLKDGFGKKDPKLLRIVPEAQLRAQGIRPAPGMRLSIDGNYGVVKRTGGGRTVVDFNHPLASHDVTYVVELHGQVTDLAEQVRALLPKKTDVKVEGKHATITLPSIPPKPLMDAIQQRITASTTVTTVTFEARRQ